MEPFITANNPNPYNTKLDYVNNSTPGKIYNTGVIDSELAAIYDIDRRCNLAPNKIYTVLDRYLLEYFQKIRDLDS
jgi:hypothetical protein